MTNKGKGLIMWSKVERLLEVRQRVSEPFMMQEKQKGIV